MVSCQRFFLRKTVGHTKRKRPRRGSLQFWHRKRASRQHPRIRSWSKKNDIKLLGFAGYKAGMTAISFIDNRPKSATKGDEIVMPVTIIETPSLRVLSLRVFSRSFYGLSLVGEVWSDQISQDLKRVLSLPKKRGEFEGLKFLEEKLSKAVEIRVIVYTQPRKAGFGRKKPEIMEIAIGGSDIKAQFEYAKGLLGKDILISDVFKEGEFLDVHAVTKGKGFQGVIKRFGVTRKQHKSEKGTRRIGTLGNWDAVTWRVPHPGQMGYHTRTEYNKQLLKIGNVKDLDINPKGGLIRYGNIKGDYILVAGSVPGPKKRLIRLTHAIRQPKLAITQAPEIQNISIESQQR